MHLSMEHQGHLELEGCATKDVCKPDRVAAFIRQNVHMRTGELYTSRAQLTNVQQFRMYQVSNGFVVAWTLLK
jgi:hypothetical protein